MDDSQLMKGILELCVLGVISRGETYGYAILSALDGYGFDSPGEGTLYPILTRLDKNGYISCRKEKSPLGPVRKYYAITPSGENYYRSCRQRFRQVVSCAERILEEEEK